MQPGNASKARPSLLTTVDADFKGLSEGLAFEDRKGWVPWRMQTVDWDTAIVSQLTYCSQLREDITGAANSFWEPVTYILRNPCSNQDLGESPIFVHNNAIMKTTDFCLYRLSFFWRSKTLHQLDILVCTSCTWLTLVNCHVPIKWDGCKD